ncbi:MAG: hypothetical protein ACPGUV_13000, partial [Polyangiales bacterium]
SNLLRQRRLKKRYRSVLDAVPGIGAALRRRLLRRFDSLSVIAAASDAALQEAGVPARLIAGLREHLRPHTGLTGQPAG